MPAVWRWDHVLAGPGAHPGRIADRARRPTRYRRLETSRRRGRPRPGDRLGRIVASIIGIVDDRAPGEEIPWAVRRFFEALAAERPLVLLVDDFQWAEPGLVDLFQHLLDLGRGPILLVTIGRPELEELRPEWFARASLSVVRLDALDASDAGVLVDHLAPELRPGSLRSRILAAAEGNPLFLEQFVAYASDEVDAGARRLTDRTRQDLPIPPTIGALLAARLDRLPDVERQLLERASVIGRTFWVGALVNLLDEGDRAELPRRLAHLVRRDLIRADDPTSSTTKHFASAISSSAMPPTSPSRSANEPSCTSPSPGGWRTALLKNLESPSSSSGTTWSRRIDIGRSSAMTQPGPGRSPIELSGTSVLPDWPRSSEAIRTPPRRSSGARSTSLRRDTSE